MSNLEGEAKTISSEAQTEPPASASLLVPKPGSTNAAVTSGEAPAATARRPASKPVPRIPRPDVSPGTQLYSGLARASLLTTVKPLSSPPTKAAEPASAPKPAARRGAVALAPESPHGMSDSPEIAPGAAEIAPGGPEVKPASVPPPPRPNGAKAASHPPPRIGSAGRLSSSQPGEVPKPPRPPSAPPSRRSQPPPSGATETSLFNVPSEPSAPTEPLPTPLEPVVVSDEPTGALPASSTSHLPPAPDGSVPPRAASPAEEVSERFHQESTTPREAEPNPRALLESESSPEPEGAEAKGNVETDAAKADENVGHLDASPAADTASGKQGTSKKDSSKRSKKQRNRERKAEKRREKRKEALATEPAKRPADDAPRDAGPKAAQPKKKTKEPEPQRPTQDARPLNARLQAPSSSPPQVLAGLSGRQRLSAVVALVLVVALLVYALL